MRQLISISAQKITPKKLYNIYKSRADAINNNRKLKSTHIPEAPEFCISDEGEVKELDYYLQFFDNEIEETPEVIAFDVNWKSSYIGEEMSAVGVYEVLEHCKFTPVMLKKIKIDDDSKYIPDETILLFDLRYYGSGYDDDGGCEITFLGVVDMDSIIPTQSHAEYVEEIKEELSKTFPNVYFKFGTYYEEGAETFINFNKEHLKNEEFKKQMGLIEERLEAKWKLFFSGRSEPGYLTFVNTKWTKMYDTDPEVSITKNVLEKYWVAKCQKCGWVGMSCDCTGGGQIADTGDYSDCTCPNCGTVVDDAEEGKDYKVYEDE